MKSKPVSSILYGLCNQLLPPGSCPGLLLRGTVMWKCKPNKPFLPKRLRSWCFITATVNLAKTGAFLKVCSRPYWSTRASSRRETLSQKNKTKQKSKDMKRMSYVSTWSFWERWRPGRNSLDSLYLTKAHQTHSLMYLLKLTANVTTCFVRFNNKNEKCFVWITPFIFFPSSSSFFFGFGFFFQGFFV